MAHTRFLSPSLARPLVHCAFAPPQLIARSPALGSQTLGWTGLTALIPARVFPPIPPLPVHLAHLPPHMLRGPLLPPVLPALHSLRHQPNRPSSPPCRHQLGHRVCISLCRRTGQRGGILRAHLRCSFRSCPFSLENRCTPVRPTCPAHNHGTCLRPNFPPHEIRRETEVSRCHKMRRHAWIRP